MSLIDELTRHGPFQRLSPEGQSLLAAGVAARDCTPGGVILHKGTPVSGAYLVLAGRLRVFSLTPGGLEATLYFIDPGQTCILALNCLFNDLLYPAWVQAEGRARVAVIPGPVYRQLFEREPSIQDMTVQALSTLVFRLMAELEQVHGSHHRERLAAFILTHASSDGTLQVTQQQLAGHLGTTREVIARLMQELTAKGMVRTARGCITITDLFGLRRLIEARGG